MLYLKDVCLVAHVASLYWRVLKGKYHNLLFVNTNVEEAIRREITIE